MPLFICTACGMQYRATAQAMPPAQCAICEEERQYVPPRGQSLDHARRARAKPHEQLPRIRGRRHRHRRGFAIGQRALLVRTDGRQHAVGLRRHARRRDRDHDQGLGGIKAIAISHPHFYTTMVEWARAFGARIHLHAADTAWIMRPDPAIELWDGETNKLWDGVTLVRCGGHFEGGTVLHWAAARAGAASSAPATFSPSPPTASGSPSCAAIRISFRCRRARSSISARRMAPFAFDTLYGHYFDRVIAKDAKPVLEKSVARYHRGGGGEDGGY